MKSSRAMFRGIGTMAMLPCWSRTVTSTLPVIGLKLIETKGVIVSVGPVHDAMFTRLPTARSHYPEQ